MISASAAAIAGGVLLVALISLFVAHALVRARLGRREDQPEAQKQELYHRFRLARVPRGLLFLLFQGADAYPGSCCECCRLRREHPAQCLSAVSLWPRRHRRPAGDGHCVRCFAALFLLLYRLISRSFLKIATSSGKTERKVYRETRTERQSASAALLRKEFSRFTASPNYMLNCGLGTLMLPIAGVVLLVYQAKIRDLELLLGAEFASLLFIAAVCLLASMNDMAAPSVSLEGKSLWLAQSLPVKPWQVLRAKLAVHLTLTGVPAAGLLCAAGICTPVFRRRAAARRGADRGLCAADGLLRPVRRAEGCRICTGRMRSRPSSRAAR